MLHCQIFPLPCRKSLLEKHSLFTSHLVLLSERMEVTITLISPLCRCVSTNKCLNGEVSCHENAHCFKNGDGFKCVCKMGFRGDGMEACDDMCTGYCFNQGKCTKDTRGNPFCECAAMYYGERCQSKSETAYIAGGIAGAVLLLILIILLIWMICVRTRSRRAVPSTAKTSPYSINPRDSSTLYAIEYPPSCSTTATVRSHPYVPYYDNDDIWNMSGYGNAGYVDGNSMDKSSMLKRKKGKKAETPPMYDVMNRQQQLPMKEVVMIDPSMDSPPKAASDDEHSARL